MPPRRLDWRLTKLLQTAWGDAPPPFLDHTANYWFIEEGFFFFSLDTHYICSKLTYLTIWLVHEWQWSSSSPSCQAEDVEVGRLRRRRYKREEGKHISCRGADWASVGFFLFWSFFLQKRLTCWCAEFNLWTGQSLLWSNRQAWHPSACQEIPAERIKN